MTERADHPPENPAVAMLAAILFKRLGGSIENDGGRRRLYRPEPVIFELRGEGLPQLPDAEPHEQFHSADEWRGAVKVAEYLLRHLGPADQELIFTLAPVNVHPGDGFDFRSMLGGPDSKDYRE